MHITAPPLLRDQLLERRRRLDIATRSPYGAEEAERLLHEVDEALQRLATGTFGLCETCGDPVEPDRLQADPLVRFCIDHLTPVEQRALERDLDLAGRIQRELLPRLEAPVEGWEVAYHYEPAGPVSGDYCDLIASGRPDVHFLVGDVAGKGIAAALLMSHLSALLRTLVGLDLPVGQIMERANRMFCESTPAAQYATLVCARALPDGIEICNAGHPPPLIVRADAVQQVPATGVPIGMFCSAHYTSQTVQMDAGDTLLLYSDGVIEARDPRDAEYGIDRLVAASSAAAHRPPQAFIGACLRDLTDFRRSAPVADDVTLMAVRRAQT